MPNPSTREHPGLGHAGLAHPGLAQPGLAHPGLETPGLETPGPETPGAVVDEVFEASSAEAAIAAVHERLGPDARIVHAERCLRGGLAGFFAKQVVRLTAAPAAPTVGLEPPTAGVEPPPGAPDTPSRAPAPPHGVPAASPRGPAGRTGTAAVDRLAVSPVDRLLDVDEPSAESRESGGNFADLLRGHRDAAATRAPAGLAAEHDDGPRWSRSALIRLGLPSALVDALDVHDGARDLAWLGALSAAVRPLCRPLPSGPCVYIGPLAGTFEHTARNDAATVARSAVFREAMKATHWPHAVAGGPQWREVLDDEPLAMSWGESDALPDAVGCAYDLGLVLGSGPLAGVVRRARPLDVAIGVRSLLDDAAAARPRGDGR